MSHHRAAAGSVAVARTPTEIETLAPAWDRLVQHPNADRDFVAAYAAARGQCSPLVLAWPDLQAPTAICVARLQHTRLPIKLGYRTLLAPRVRALEVIRGGLAGNVDDDVAAAFAEHLCAMLADGTADVLTVEHLPIASPLAAALRRRGATASTPSPDRHWTATLPPDYDAFLQSRSSNTRRNLKRFEKGFFAAFEGRFKIQSYDQPAAADKIAADLEQISRATYHRGLGAGFIDSPLQRALLAQGLRTGCYRALVLEVEGRPIAFWDGRTYRGTFHTETTGYLPEFQEQRPGWFVLMHLVHELCCDPHVDRIDFGIGDAQYKQMLCDRSEEEQPLLLFAPSLRARAIRGAQTTANATARGLRRVLQRLGVLQRIKQFWRRRLQPKAGPTAPVTPTDQPADRSRTPPGS